VCGVRGIYASGGRRLGGVEGLSGVDERVVWRVDCHNQFVFNGLNRGFVDGLMARGVGCRAGMGVVARRLLHVRRSYFAVRGIKTNQSKIQRGKDVMKKFAIAALLAGTMLVPVSEAAQVVFSNPAWRDASYGGGEFGADIDGNGSVDFYTFCLERNEGLSFNKPYDYTLGVAAVGGGLGGGNPDPISQGTSYLYNRFLNSNLPGYSFATGNPVDNAARAASGRSLQNAIWMLEQEQAVDLSNPFVNLVVGVFGSLANAMADAVTGGIGVLNPTDPSVPQTSPLWRRQSVLINLPDNGMAVMLLGGSLMLIGAARRRMA